MTDNTYTKSIEEKLNIILDLTVVPKDGYADKLKIALSTGDYPELIMSNAATKSNNDIVNYGMKEQIYIPLNDLINDYAVNFLDRCEEMPEILPGITAQTAIFMRCPLSKEL